MDSGGATITGRGECVPLDVSDKFESQPTKAQVEAEAAAYMSEHNTFYPSQNIKVDFVRLQDMGYENLGSLMQCNLCDTIKVIFPDYNSSGTYKIVKTVWDVLSDRYDEMELGELSTTLAEALGVGGGSLGGGGSDLNAYLKKTDLVVDTLNASFSFSSQRYKQVTKDVSKTGYTPIGIVGWKFSTVDWFLSQCYLSSTTAYLYL